MGNDSSKQDLESASLASRATRPNTPSGSIRGRSPSPQGKHAVATLRMEALTLWVVERSADFPSKHKFTLGQCWLDASLAALEALLEGAYQKDKRGALLAASRALLRAQVLARLASGVKALSPKQLLYFEKESAEIGRMVGGWLKSLEARGSAVPSVAPSVQRGHESAGSLSARSCQGMEGQAPTV